MTEKDQGILALETRLAGAGIGLARQAELAPYLTLGIGGQARLLATCGRESDLAMAARACREAGVPLLLIGGGSNLAFEDGSGEFLAVVNRVGGIESLGEDRLIVGSGVRTGVFLAECLARGLGGAEFLAGIPGTVGGAVVVNAGAFGRSISEILVGAEVLDESGASRRVEPDYFAYAYRHSALKLSADVVVRLILQLRPEKKTEIRSRLAEHKRYRKEKHPSYRLATAGCFFKNPIVGGKKTSAGKLLEECGMAGERIGPILLSERHANFLINAGGATFGQLQEAEEAIRRRVLQKKGIRLEREVVYVSSRGEKY